MDEDDENYDLNDNEAEFEARYLDQEGVVGRFSYDFSEDSLGWRVGGGIQFNIARGLVLRAMYRYIKIKTDAVNSLQEYSVGIRFLF
jgi:opacity protein-like surface antigen